MLVSNISYPVYSQQHVFFTGRCPSKKTLEAAKEKLGPRPSRELLETLINNGLDNQAIATKLKRAVQTIKGLRCLYKLPSEHDLLVQKRTEIVMERLKAGASRSDLAKELGVSTGTINIIAEKFNAFGQYISERDEKIIQMFDSGVARKDIAQILNISPDTVKRALKKYNLHYKDSYRKYDYEILAKLAQNESNKQIKEDLNISMTPILRIKKKNGLTRTYNKLPKNQPIQWVEIMEESKKVTEIRQNFKRLKQGERSIEVLDHISTTLDALKAKIEEFKSRLQPPTD